MDTSPLVTEDIDAGMEFLRLMDDHRHVKAACWLRAAEDEERYLCVALEGLSVGNMDDAYGEVLRITNSMKEHYVDPFRVKLIPPSDPVAVAVLGIYERFPTRIPTRFDGHLFAGTAVAEVYVYPPLLTKP